ncbi:GNAT family N-acetyltransferase [Photobacterium lipolyticum]|uniref:GNAT family N-acetyltransferase n=1 Tax=Photobacterium lipolyticum TaxID=266810 RepID=A0A2T3MYY9_9GAMM|nr:GNAT family N-acetyltransferase [Photobacterium lipolyticum]PSW05185.1 GNAT family N-acetyltransferase [Photobacterium lipolyticum]
MTAFTLRPFEVEDTPVLARIYTRAATISGREHYSQPQIEMWANFPVQHFDEFQAMLKQGHTYLAIDHQGKPLGFAQLHPTNHLTLLYVLPEFSRQGIGQQLYKHLEAIAIADKQAFISVTASIISKGLFKKMGFISVETEISLRNNIAFERYNMTKYLGENT